MEELQARHRKEQRDLHSKVTQKKKNASKKTRKGVNEECDALQRDLQERQLAELAALGRNAIVDDIQALQLHDNGNQTHKPRLFDNAERGEPGVGVQEDTDVARFSGVAPHGNSAPTLEGRSKKPNRQKARLARRAAAQEAQIAKAAGEAANLPNLRQQELEAMKEHITRLGLTEISIRPDGHCMYSAVATQVTEKQLQTSESYHSSLVKAYQLVRNTAGDFISKHPDDFAAFLEEPLDVYVSKIKDTAEWGGQLELQAVARAYGIDINVLQADGRVVKIESRSSSARDPVWLAYYRHSYSLGEHYNALERLP